MTAYDGRGIRRPSSQLTKNQLSRRQAALQRWQQVGRFPQEVDDGRARHHPLFLISWPQGSNRSSYIWSRGDERPVLTQFAKRDPRLEARLENRY
jgi:hypothetical protein